MSLYTSLACSPVQPAEFDAATNIVSSSQHTHLAFLPNHHLTRDGKLQGFHFTASLGDKLHVLQMPDNMFRCSCLYEIGAVSCDEIGDAGQLSDAAHASDARGRELQYESKTPPACARGARLRFGLQLIVDARSLF